MHPDQAEVASVARDEPRKTRDERNARAKQALAMRAGKRKKAKKLGKSHTFATPLVPDRVLAIAIK